MGELCATALTGFAGALQVEDLQKYWYITTEPGTLEYRYVSC
jgi:hypothetical protein